MNIPQSQTSFFCEQTDLNQPETRISSGQVLWIRSGRKALPPSTSPPVMSEIAGVNTASPDGYLQSTKTRARWAKGLHDELNGQVFDLERDGLRQVVLCPRLTMR